MQRTMIMDMILQILTVNLDSMTAVTVLKPTMISKLMSLIYLWKGTLHNFLSENSAILLTTSNPKNNKTLHLPITMTYLVKNRINLPIKMRVIPQLYRNLGRQLNLGKNPSLGNHMKPRKDQNTISLQI